MRANPFLFTIVLVSLLTASLAAPLSQAQAGAVAFQFPDSFDDALDAENVEPRGTWERALERVTFFLDHDEPFDEQEPAGQTPPLGTVGYYHYEPPQPVVPFEQATGEELFLDPNHENDKRVVLSQAPSIGSTEAVFKLPRGVAPFTQFDLNPTRPFWVYGFEATIYVSCTGVSQTGVATASMVSVDLRLRELNPDGSEGDVRSYSSSSQVDFINNVAATGTGRVSNTDAVFKLTIQGHEDLGNFNLGFGERERVDPESEVLEFAVQMANHGSCTLHYGSQNFPSNFRLVTDTATINTWVEDKQSQYTVGLPSAEPTASGERRMNAAFLQATAWPDLNQFQHQLSEPADYMDQIWTNLYYDNPLGELQSNPNNPHYGDLSHGDKQWFLRWTNPDQESILYDTRTGDSDQRNTPIKPFVDDRNPTPIESGLNLNRFQFLYTAELGDGVYQYEIYNQDRRLAASTPVTVGLKGFSLGLIDSRAADDPAIKVHEVEVDEPTTFLLELRNTGAQADTISLSTTSPGTGWTAELAVDSVALPAGSDDVNNVGVHVPLTVTPSPTAKLDDLRTFRVTAASGAFPSEVPNQELELRVRVVSEKAKDVELFNLPEEVTVAPGASFTLAGMFAHNLGSSAQTFLIETQTPLDARGWTSRATPPARLIEAGSVEPFSLKVTVAADAPSGSSVDLPVTVRLVGDNSIVDTVLVTVNVLLEHRLQFDVSSTLVPMRKAVETCFEVDGTQRAGRDPLGGDPANVCSTDSKSDRSALYRLRFTNPGTVDETYTLKGDWEGGSYGGQSVSFNNDCGQPPKFWHLDYGESHNDVASGSPHRDPRVLETIAVPAGQTVTRYIEMGYEWPTGLNNPIDWLFCSHTPSNISPAAAYRLVATVDNAPGQKAQHTIAAYMVSEDVHTPVLERAIDPATSVSTPEEKESQLVDQEFEDVRYRFVVRNEASEHGTVSVSVRDVHPLEGYSQHLEIISKPLSTTSCDTVNDGLTYTCKDLGVHGEATFDLVVKPDASVIGVDHPDLRHTVTAVSTSGGASSSLLFSTDLVGEFQFEAIEVARSRDAHPGQEVNLPFQVQNLGTRDDTYSITLSTGDPDWRPRMSTDDLVFVAGEHNLEAFLRVQVPETAQKDHTETFQVRIASSDPSKGADELTFTVRVVEDVGIVVQGAGGTDQVLMEGRDQPQTITVEAVDPASAVGEPITFRVDRNKLPSGWRVEQPVLTGAVETDSQGHVASADFVITAPRNAIGTSSVPLIVEACRGDQTVCKESADFTARGDIILNLQDDVGVFMRLDDPDAVTATLPGGSVVLPVLVQNAGLSADIIDLSSTEAKTGWSITYDPPVLPLAPLESRVVDVIVKTPSSAPTGEELDFILFATSRNEPSEFAQLQLTAGIGVFDLEWSSKNKEVSLAPGETHTFVARVHNNGTLPDSVAGQGGLATAAAKEAYGSLVDVTLDPKTFDLRPGQGRDVVVSVRLATAVPPQATIPVEARFASLENLPSEVVPTFDVKVFDYMALDVDGDGIVEFAVDRNGDRGDGYESFLDPSPDAGTRTEPAQLVRFLSEEGRLRHTIKDTVDNKTVDRVHLRIDGDPGARNFGDGKTDLMLDTTGDGLPDLYWDPDDEHSSRLSVFKDINADGVPDYFVDTSGNGEFNAVYDLAQGTFMKLLARDVDNDGTMDYAVDKNGNGRVDGDETVLFSRDGKLIQVTKVDVDGDGQLDEVFDTDGDGVPDSFIPAEKTKGVPLTVDRDLNKDGFLDWAYDANRDGRDDHYYDPAAQSGGHQIDAQAEFVRSLQEFWYVGALFVLVAALFVVLVAVTRR